MTLMTDHLHQPPSPTRSDTPSRILGWLLGPVGRRLALLLGAAGTAYASLVLAFLGSIAITGCFISCSEPNYAAGLLAAAGFVGTGTLTVTAVTAVFSKTKATTIMLRVLPWMAGVTVLGVLSLLQAW